MKKNIVESALGFFRRETVLTVDELSNFHNWPAVTARRYLKRWGAYTSYNMNGRYYVLPEVPVFDENGLWSIREIRFSRYGNLKRTILRLVENAPEGLDASDISDLLGLGSHSLLARLEKASVLAREKHGGRFVYFSPDAAVFERQSGRRRALPEKAGGVLTDAMAVVVLVERIKNPRLDLPRLIERLRKQGLAMDPSAVRDFLFRHGLLKKTLDFRRF